MLYFFDLFGTFAFGLAGAFRAIKYELDILGLLVLATATGIGGGVMRDILLNADRPAAFADETYLLVCLGAGVAAWAAPLSIAQRWDWVKLADAVGLGVFSAIGAAKAHAAGFGPVGVVLLASVTATGGGVLRDILVREIPAVLRVDFYATAALCGGIAFLATTALGAPRPACLVVAAVVGTGLRLLAMWLGLGLPHVRSLPASPSELSHRRRE